MQLAGLAPEDLTRANEMLKEPRRNLRPPTDTLRSILPVSHDSVMQVPGCDALKLKKTAAEPEERR